MQINNIIWNDVNAKLPISSGRYWCVISEQTDLGIVYSQCNCGYNEHDKNWTSEI